MMTSPKGFQPSLFHHQLLKSRALLFASGITIAVAAKAAGKLDVGWLSILLFSVISIGSALGFAAATAKGVEQLAGLSLFNACMMLDVGFFVWVVMATGGSESSWFPWALANVTAAAYVRGRRGAAVVMVATLLSYLLAVGIREPPQAMLGVIIRMMVLFGAGFLAVREVCDRHSKGLTISELRDQEAGRTAEIERLATKLEERTQQRDGLAEELHRASVIDPLTGLHNRRYLQERIAQDVAMVRRAFAVSRPGVSSQPENSDLGFVMLDIDHLKQVNELFGRDGGDEIITQLPAVISDAVREIDSLIRWGGDRFLIVLREVNRDRLQDVAKRLSKTICEYAFVVDGGKRVEVSCSLGFSHLPMGDFGHFSWQQVIQIADAAVQLAKRTGRGTSVGVLCGDRKFDRAGRALVEKNLTAAARQGYVRLLQASP